LPICRFLSQTCLFTLPGNCMFLRNPDLISLLLRQFSLSSNALKLGQLIFSYVYLKTWVYDLMEPLSDDCLSLTILTDGHNLFNLALTLLYSLIHMLIIALHLLNNSIIGLLFWYYACIAAFLHVSFDLLSIRLINFFKVDSKIIFFSTEQFFQLSQILASLDFCEDRLLNIFDLVINGLKEKINCRLKLLLDLLRSNLVHFLQWILVSSKLFIKEIL